MKPGPARIFAEKPVPSGEANIGWKIRSEPTGLLQSRAATGRIGYPTPNRRAAMAAMVPPMLIEAVAAGDGALSTWIVRRSPAM